MAAIYILFAFAYPIIFIVVSASEKNHGRNVLVQINGQIQKEQTLFCPKNAMVINMPFIVIFVFHLLAILPQLLC